MEFGIGKNIFLFDSVKDEKAIVNLLFYTCIITIILLKYKEIFREDVKIIIIKKSCR